MGRHVVLHGGEHIARRLHLLLQRRKVPDVAWMACPTIALTTIEIGFPRTGGHTEASTCCTDMMSPALPQFFQGTGTANAAVGKSHSTVRKLAPAATRTSFTDPPPFQTMA